MPHIDFLIPGDIETRTGGYAYDRNLAAGLRRAGWQVELTSVGEDPQTPQFRCSAAAQFAELPDDSLVMIDGLALAGLAEAITEHRRRLRLCALVHHPAGLETGLSGAAAARIAQREHTALQAMQLIFCTSHWTARQLAEQGLAPERIHVVEPGIDASALTDRPQSIRRDPQDAHVEGMRLLCVATVTPRKGHDVLIEALAQLQDLDWQLECIGSMSRAPQHTALIEALIDRHALAGRVVLRGEVSRAELALAYARSDLFVLASHLEGYGMVLAEACAAGLPVVATRAGAVVETLEHRAAAVLVEPGAPGALAQGLRAVLGDRRAWLELAAAAAADVRPLRSWDAVAAQFSAALESRAHR